MEARVILRITSEVLLEHNCPGCGRYLYTVVIDAEGKMTGDPGWDYCPFCAEPLWSGY